MRQAAILLVLSLALAQKYEPSPITGLPWYKPEEILKGKIPYVNVIHQRRLKQHKEAQAQGKGETYTYEWRLPLSTLEGTRAVAKDVLKAWQRLEERSYARAMAELTSSLATPLGCELAKALWPAIGFPLDPPKPEVKIGTVPEFFPEDLRQALSPKGVASAGALRLDRYSYWHAGGFFAMRVPPQDYCNDLPLRIWFPYIPGTCWKFPGDIKICTPGYPDPLYLDMGELEARIRTAMEHAVTRYIPEYEKDILEALRPRGDVGNIAQILDAKAPKDPEVFLPTAWSGALVGSGAVTTPVIRLIPDAELLGQLKDVLDTILNPPYSGELKAASPVYYYPALKGLIARFKVNLSLPDLAEDVMNLGLSLLQGGRYRDPLVRGIYPLEELKRFFPVSRPEVHESLGYTSYFQVFGRIETVVLPNPPGGESFIRSFHIWNVPIVCEFMGPCYPDLPNIRPIPIAPYTYVYAGPRYYWDWISVPEGYPIPRVKGLPLTLLNPR